MFRHLRVVWLQNYAKNGKWLTSWTPSLISERAPGVFQGTFSMLFYTHSWTYPEKFSFSGCKLMIKMENGGHFGRHLGFRKELQGDFRGLLVCYSTHIHRPILKKSACYELFPG